MSHNGVLVIFCRAYGLARFARLQPGDLVVDPMGGVGTIPIEASQTWPHVRYISGDIDKKDTESATINAKQFVRVSSDFLQTPILSKAFLNYAYL